MSSDGVFLETAAGLARRIADDAVWCEGRCSWVGAVADTARPWRAEYRALDPDVHGGTAGVGLALAQIANATGEASVRRAALGAIRHAVSRAPLLPPARMDGLHGGAPGIAWAAAQAAELLGEDELHAGARAVIEAASPPASPARCPDLVTGAAGSVVALLALADAFDDPTLVDRALALGADLIARATVTAHGWSWTIAGRRRGLCGLAHGAAGVAWAMLDLFAVTGDGRFGDAALAAFAYERSWRSDDGAWPDLRLPGQRRGARRAVGSAATGTWCHGEAGIALARLHALAVLGPGPHVEDAEVALEATRRHLAAALPHAIEDVSLCHGAGGSADVLLSGAAALGGARDGASEVAVALGRSVVQRHSAAGDWPCAVRGATAPGLFVGLAGIAWFLLRLHDAGVPSPLSSPPPRLTVALANP